MTGNNPLNRKRKSCFKLITWNTHSATSTTVFVQIMPLAGSFGLSVRRLENLNSRDHIQVVLAIPV